MLHITNIREKYTIIAQNDTSNLLIETPYQTFDEFMIEKRKKSDELFDEVDDKNYYLKFLSCLEEYKKYYETIYQKDDSINNAYVQLYVSSSTPTVGGYSFSFEQTLIYACECCESYFIDCIQNNEMYDKSNINKFIEDFFADVRIMQIKNIDKLKKVKVLCNGNYFVMDQRILINETCDMRSDYEKLF